MHDFALYCIFLQFYTGCKETPFTWEAFQKETIRMSTPDHHPKCRNLNAHEDVNLYCSSPFHTVFERFHIILFSMMDLVKGDSLMT